MHKAWLAGTVPRQIPEPSIAFLSWSCLLFHTVKGTFLWTPTSASVTSFSFEFPALGYRAKPTVSSTGAGLRACPQALCHHAAILIFS